MVVCVTAVEKCSLESRCSP